jgi:ankyrin repeat protein
VVQALLTTGTVDPDAKNIFGETPLSRAASRGHETVVQALLATGKVNPDADTLFWLTRYENETAVKVR